MDWNARYVNEDTPWDHGEFASELSLLLKRADYWEGKRVLVPGCGRGHEVRELAKHAEHVIGADLSEQALAEARVLTHQPNVSYIQGDVFEGANSFAGIEIIFEHTFYCAIPPELREAYVDWAATILSRGGKLAGLFYIENKESECLGGPPWGTGMNDLRKNFDRRFEVVDLSDIAPAGSYRSSKTPMVFVRK